MPADDVMQIVVDCATGTSSVVALTPAEVDAHATLSADHVAQVRAAQSARDDDLATLRASTNPEVQALVRVLGLGG